MAQNRSVSKKQAFMMVYLFLIGSTMVEDGAHPAKQDVWISVLIAAVGVIPVMLIYLRLMRLHPGKSLFEIILTAVGRPVGTVISALYILYFLQTTGLVVRNFTHFITENALRNTPIAVLALPLCVLAAWMASLDLDRIAKGAVILGIVYLIVQILALLLLIAPGDWHHLFPMFTSDPAVILDESFSFFSVPLSQSVIFLAVLHEMEDTKKRGRSLFIAVFIFVLTSISNYLRAITSFGGEALGDLSFQTYNAARILQIGDFAARLEMWVSGIFIIAVLVKIVLFIFVSGSGIRQLAPKAKKSVVFPVMGIAVFGISLFAFHSNYEVFNGVKYYRVYALLFQVVFPALMWIISEIRALVQKRKAKALSVLTDSTK